MNSPQELWLRLDTASTRLRQCLHWLTSLDKEKQHIKNAINELEQAKRILEAKS
jgi:hypothetical protein